MTKKQKKMLFRIIIASVMLIGLAFMSVKGFIRLPLYLFVYFIIGYDILKKAGRGIINGRVFDENFLMAIATVGAFALAIYEKNGEYSEGITVMLFYQIGELFESYAVGKSRKNIGELMDVRPDYARIEINGKRDKINPNEVRVGSIIEVLPGEKIPIDGVVTEGRSTLDMSALTGESKPCDIHENDDVISGSINMTGVLKIRTTKEFGESTVSKILSLVEDASSNKSKSEAFISRFARIYTPTVCLSALALAVLPPLISLIIGGLPQWGIWFYRALTFLVVSCPCALVISIPLTFFAGIGGLSSAGILVKGSNYLENLSKVKCIVFDKTGTLTKGVFEVSGIHHNELENQKLLEYAALAESGSNHPISKSLQKAYGKELERTRVSDFSEIGGYGITATVDGKSIVLGNGKMMERFNIKYHNCHSVGTIIHIAIDGEYAGHIVVSDILKENAKNTISQLKKASIKKTVMLTGDREKVASCVGEQLGIDEIHSGLLPTDKVCELEKLLEDKAYNEQVAFVGDGINDAPVIMRADIGIAMGAIGSDAAIEAADVVLMNDDPMQLVKAIRLSRRCITIVKENIVFALAVKFICLLLTAMGFANMWLAIFADVGVMVIAVLNAVRALRTGKMR